MKKCDANYSTDFLYFCSKIDISISCQKFSKTYFRIISFSEKNAIIILKNVFKNIRDKVKEFFIEWQAHAHEGI